MEWIEILWLSVLAILSVEDVKTRKISVFPIIYFFPCLLFALFGREQMEWNDSILGMLVGFLFCAVSYLKKESIGMGDGIVISLLGLWLGVRKVLFVLVVASSLTVLAAVVLCIIHKADVKTKLPFVPFLFAGYLVNMCWFME